MEDRGEDGDEGEARGERRELSQRSMQLLLVAELREVTVVVRRRGECGCGGGLRSGVVALNGVLLRRSDSEANNCRLIVFAKSTRRR